MIERGGLERSTIEFSVRSVAKNLDDRGERTRTREADGRAQTRCLIRLPHSGNLRW